MPPKKDHLKDHLKVHQKDHLKKRKAPAHAKLQTEVIKMIVAQQMLNFQKQ